MAIVCLMSDFNNSGGVNAQEMREDGMTYDEVSDCILKDAEKVGAIHDAFTRGGYIDDREVLIEKWSPSMGIVAVNYCTKKDEFRSLQLVVGKDDIEIPLRKHG